MNLTIGQRVRISYKRGTDIWWLAGRIIFVDDRFVTINDRGGARMVRRDLIIDVLYLDPVEP